LTCLDEILEVDIGMEMARHVDSVIKLAIPIDERAEANADFVRDAVQAPIPGTVNDEM
jgi:hypothetical protein